MMMLSTMPTTSCCLRTLLDANEVADVQRPAQGKMKDLAFINDRHRRLIRFCRTGTAEALAC